MHLVPRPSAWGLEQQLRGAGVQTGACATGGAQSTASMFAGILIASLWCFGLEPVVYSMLKDSVLGGVIG